MEVFKTGGNFLVKMFKFDMLTDSVDGTKDSVSFMKRNGNKVELSVGRKTIQNNIFVDIEYVVTKEISPSCEKMTDNELVKFIDENKGEVTKGFYAYMAAMIISVLNTAGMGPIFTSMEYISE